MELFISTFVFVCLLIVPFLARPLGLIHLSRHTVHLRAPLSFQNSVLLSLHSVAQTSTSLLRNVGLFEVTPCDINHEMPFTNGTKSTAVSEMLRDTTGSLVYPIQGVAHSVGRTLLLGFLVIGALVLISLKEVPRGASAMFTINVRWNSSNAWLPAPRELLCQGLQIWWPGTFHAQRRYLLV